jgi:hypothetical protein
VVNGAARTAEGLIMTTGRIDRLRSQITLALALSLGAAQGCHAAVAAPQSAAPERAALPATAGDGQVSRPRSTGTIADVQPASVRQRAPESTVPARYDAQESPPLHQTQRPELVSVETGSEAILLSPEPPRTPTRQAIARIKQQLIRASIDEYDGPCPCPYNVARNGSSCGRRSAYSRPGGASPLCYSSDVSDEMVTEVWENEQEAQ